MCPFSAKGLLPYHKGSLGVLLSNPSVCWLTYGIVQVASCKRLGHWATADQDEFRGLMLMRGQHGSESKQQQADQLQVPPA